jgi:NAD(P)-dependent dehydrogenase (short-subunit alcohol dehydrogenase family)
VRLHDKNAVVYGAAGSMGGAVARAFAREGATVFLAGRTLAKLDMVAEEIRAAGGAAETAEVDAQAGSISPATPSASPPSGTCRWLSCRWTSS